MIVSDKQNHLQYLPMDEAIQHCTKGLGIWDWASNDDCGTEPDIPDVVMACCGDIPTMESLTETPLSVESLGAQSRSELLKAAHLKASSLKVTA